MTSHDSQHQIRYVVWGVISLFSVMFLIPNAVIFSIEVNKLRTVGCPKYKFLRIWSTLTIIAGLVYCLVNCVRYINGLCYITWYLSFASIRLQPVFLGNFQLSRLYYCFAARTEGMGANGYPRWVFVAMFAFSGICATSIAVPYGFLIPELCYIAPDWMYHAHYVAFSRTNSWLIHIRTYVEIGVYIPWDLAIFLLFCFSVQSIARTQMTLQSHVHSDNVPNGDRHDHAVGIIDTVSASNLNMNQNQNTNSKPMTTINDNKSTNSNSNISHGVDARAHDVRDEDTTTSTTTTTMHSAWCILGKIIPIPTAHLSDGRGITSASGLLPVFRTLYRVLTVTIFYEIVCIVIFLVNNVLFPQMPEPETLDPWLTIGELVLITAWSLSAHLMIDDNESSYRRFLELLHSFKLHYICCCYRGLVEWQIKDLRQQQGHREEVHTVQLKAGAPELPENGSYNTCTDTAELERNRTLNKEFLDRIREETAETRITISQKEGE